MSLQQESALCCTVQMTKHVALYTHAFAAYHLGFCDAVKLLSAYRTCLAWMYVAMAAATFVDVKTARSLMHVHLPAMSCL